MSFPIFLDLDTKTHLESLKGYLSGKGLKVESTSPPQLLQEIIKASSKLWNEALSESELELVFNSIISLVIVLPRESVEPLVAMVTDILKQPSLPLPDKKNISKLKLLNNLFAGLEETCKSRYLVYLSTILLASNSDLLHLVNIKLNEVKAWVGDWNVGEVEYQALLRVLLDAFVKAKQTDKASKVMVELLGTFNEKNASQAREDATKCIATSLSDPQFLLFDHLLLLKPIKFLEGEPIHELLTIFVNGTLKDYLNFYEKHSDVIITNNLNHNNNIKKVKILNFLSLVEGKSEISFEIINKELNIKYSDIEQFLIEVIKSEAAKIKIIETKKKIIINSSINRTFGKTQWVQLKDQLINWHSNLSLITNSLQNVVNNV